MIPIIVEDLFEINKNYTSSFNNEIIIIDNWYKNPEEIIKVLENIPAPRWKNSKNSKNWIDYYDCRPIIHSYWNNEKIYDPAKEIVFNINKYFFKGSKNNFNLITMPFEFNAYKNIKKNIPNRFQHFPHSEGNIFNCIIYLDKISSGGTAFYEIDSLENKEDDNLLFDVSNLEKSVVPAKFNRAVIFNGKKYHGGYIEDHSKYLNAWRINQVLFFEPVN
jgi:hypothetical protein